MQPYKEMAHINSLNGEMREVTVLAFEDNFHLIVDYNGVKCTAILNPFVWQLYADDVYGVIRNET